MHVLRTAGPVFIFGDDILKLVKWSQQTVGMFSLWWKLNLYLYTDTCGFPAYNMPQQFVQILMSLYHVRSVNTVSLKINFCLCLQWLKQLRSIKVHHSGVCVSVPHLEYWASVQFLEQHLELCKASGQFFERWLQRGKHSNPLWPFCYLENTKTVYNMCQDNSQRNTCLRKMHQSTTNPTIFLIFQNVQILFIPAHFAFSVLKCTHFLDV